MLASDREREATVLRLRAAHLDGRIDTDELEERLGRAHAARTREELDALGSDLPPPPPAATGGVPRLPGRRHFAVRRVLDAPPEAVRDALLTRVLPPLERHGFYVHREDGGTLFVENRARTGSRFRVSIADAGGGRAIVDARGAAPLSVRRAFATLTG